MEHQGIDATLLTTLDIAQIAELIPHRAPFLFLQQACINSAEMASGIACWEAYNPIFAGHFPELPIVPGVCQVEAAAQLTGVLFGFNAKHHPDGSKAQGGLGVLAGIRQTHFHAPVFPQQKMHLSLKIRAVLGPMCTVEATGFVNDKKVLSCEIKVALTDQAALANIAQSS